MKDERIVSLFWKRSELALAETAGKYGKYCHYISFNILHNKEDAEECVNDTYLNAWNSIPPHKPDLLSTYLGKLVRNLSFNKYKASLTKKRGLGETPLVLSELEECIPSPYNIENILEGVMLEEAINNFLSTLTQKRRILFMRRYFYVSSIKDIAKEYNMKENTVISLLFRTRNELRTHLEKEGFLL